MLLNSKDLYNEQTQKLALVRMQPCSLCFGIDINWVLFYSSTRTNWGDAEMY